MEKSVETQGNNGDIPISMQFLYEDLETLMKMGVVTVENGILDDRMIRRARIENATIALIGFFIVLLSLDLLLEAFSYGLLTLFIFVFLSELYSIWAMVKTNSLYKKPEKIFYERFIRKKLRFFSTATTKVNGQECVYTIFYTSIPSFVSHLVPIRVCIKKDIHKKAMELNDELYRTMKEQGPGFRDKGMKIIEDAGVETFLGAKFIFTMLTLYGRDMVSYRQ